MRTYIKPIKDTSVYAQSLLLNTGLDEILDVGKSDNNTVGLYAVRSLLQFDISEMSSSIASGQISGSPKVFLNLYTANASDLSYPQPLDICVTSQNWTEGSGFIAEQYQNPEDGASWKFRTGTQGGLLWTSLTGSVVISGSYTASFNVLAGPTYYDGISQSVLLTESNTQNVRADVTNIIETWMSGSIPNNGFVIKMPHSIETDDYSKARLAFFSRQTHTVYAPKLEVCWDDTQFETGSLLPMPTTDFKLALKNQETTYVYPYSGRIRISGRETYPGKNFYDKARYKSSKYLPSSSYYSIVDVSSNMTVIPFDEYSQISCDKDGSYFDFPTAGLARGRYYQILVKIRNSEGTTVAPVGTPFKVEKYDNE